jgi:NhaA family Na+:H+ antiporter
MRRPESSSSQLPAHALSEGADLRSTPDHVILSQYASIQKEIMSSRSLFDPRSIPPSPEELSFEDIQEGSISRKAIWSLHFLRILRIIERYFVFLQLGIITALIWANADYDSYSDLWLAPPDSHSFSFHFFINDIFMAFFFGMAMVHVTKAVSPGGSLYPLKRALAPILGTLGGVIGPTAVYLSLVAAEGVFEAQAKGWAICIATDISVAWLVATQVFGSGTHPAVEFLLLLAVADDVVGLVVIAVAYPTGDMHLIWLLLVVGAIGLCCLFRFVFRFQKWYLYIFVVGPVSWYGLYSAGVHPALALCVVVPFIPRDNLERFDHNCSLPVHVGLFFFALCNAGVAFQEIGLATLNVALSLILGKTFGIFLFTWVGTILCGLELPTGMNKSHLALLSHVSGAGLTVALFVAELAFSDPVLRAQARLGAILTIVVAPTSIGMSMIFKVVEGRRKRTACVADAI